MSRVMGTRAFDARSSVIPAVLLTVPTVALVVAMVLLPAHGPVTASAQGTTEETMPLIVPPAPEPTPEQVALAAAMRSEATLGFKRCPVISRALSGEDRPTGRPIGDDQPGAGRPGTPPELTVSSIMSAKGEPRAMINRKLRRVGDEVAPGWRVESIDPASGTVVIGQDGGQKHELHLRGRGN